MQLRGPEINPILFRDFLSHRLFMREKTSSGKLLGTSGGNSEAA